MIVPKQNQFTPLKARPTNTTADVNHPSSLAGFTLIEILLVVTLLAILAGIVILAINPPRQLAEARNAQRVADVNAILNAVYQYASDNDGQFPAGLSTESFAICKTGAPDCTDLLDLSVLTDNEKYLVIFPRDPQTDPNDNSTDYIIFLSANGRVTVSAPLTENTTEISATR